MKSAEVKPATSSKSGPGKPFFTGAGGAVQEQEGKPAFFNFGSQSGGKTIQAKLSIGKAGDSYEKEADATADKVVMRMAQPGAPVEDKHAAPAVGGKHGAPAMDGKHTAPALDGKRGAPPVDATHAAPAVQAKCAKCGQEDKLQKEKDKESPERERVQKKPIFDSNAEPPPVNKEDKMIQRCAACEGEGKVQKSGDAGGTADAGLETRLNASKGGGSPLPKGTRDHMESSMGADFSGVRIHTGSESEQMNHQLHAQAFTHKNDIYFAKGKFDTGSKDGQHLLAHELTHTIQQGGAPVKKSPDPAQNVAKNVANPAAAAAPSAAANSAQTADKAVAGPGGPAPKVPPTPGAPAAIAPPVGPAAKAAAAPGGPATKAAPGGPAAKAAPGGPATKAAAAPGGLGGKAAPGGPATKATPGGSARKGAAGLAARKSIAAPPTFDGVAEQKERIAHAHNSEYKAAALVQSAQLEQNTELCRLAINQIALLRTQEIRLWFAEKRNSINQFFVGTAQNVLDAIQQKQLLFMQMSIAAMVKVQTFVADTEQGAIKLADQVHDQLSDAIDRVSNGITDAINAVAGTITGFISSIPIPDLPGAGAIRSAIAGLVNRAAGAVTGMISSITHALQTALTKVTQIITEIIRTVGEIIQQLLSTIFEAIMRVQVTLFVAVNRIGNMIISRMTSFLQGTVWPMLQRGEDYLTDQVDEARLIRLMQLEDNEEQVLQAMADVLDPKTKPKQKGAAATTREQRLLYFRQVEQVGARRNEEIVALFLVETSSFFLIAIHKVIAFIEFMYSAWQTAIRQFIENISSMVNSAIQKVKDLISEEIDKMKAFFSKLWDTLVKMGSKFVALVSGVKDAVAKLVSTAAEHIWSRISQKVKDFITGGGGDDSSGPALAFAGGGGSPVLNFLGPDLEPEWEEFITELEELEPVVEEGLTLVEEEALLVEEGAVVVEEVEVVVVVVVEGWEVVLIILLIIVILILLILIAYLIYLLIEELLKPKPTPIPIPVPVPDPVPDPDPDDPDKDKCPPGEIFAPTAPTGLTPADPIGIIWYKPLSLYENPITIRGRTYRMTVTNQPLPPPFGNDKIGVSRQFLPAVGKPINMFKVPDRGGQGKFFRRLRRAGFSWRGSGGNRLSPDHVQDLFWNGTDEFDNLWPLDSVYNEAVGRLQNQDQLIFFRPDPKSPCAVILSIQEARDRFGTPNMQRRRYIIISIEEMP